MSKLKTLLGWPTTTLTVDGVVYTPSPPGAPELAEIESWLEQRAPDPLELVKSRLEGFPPNIQMMLAREAYLDAKKGSRALGSELAQDLLSSHEGVAFILYLLLRKNHPEVTIERAHELVMLVGIEAAQASIDGSMSTGDPVNPSPAADGATTVTAPTSAASTGSSSTAG